MSEAFDLHWDRGGELYEEAKFEEAILEWREALCIQPDNSVAYYNIGLALSEMNHQEEAIYEWQEAIRLSPDYGKPHRSLAMPFQSRVPRKHQRRCVPQSVCALTAPTFMFGLAIILW